MKTNLSLCTPAEVETECLVVVVLDRGAKDKPEVSIETSDAAVKSCRGRRHRQRRSYGEELSKSTLLHHPAKLKAKRLLLLGGGKAKNFSAFDLRKLAGAAVRALKPRGIRSFAFVAPEASAGREAR